MAGDLIDRLRAGERSVMGRAVSIAENGGAQGLELLRLTRAHQTGTRVIGFTGSPGSGKSTLIDAMITELRHRKLTVAVVAIDPSSPISGGAVLGDRCRMGRHQQDPGVYIRSLSARGGVGGLSAGAGRVLDVLKATPFDIILVETVGAGQSEIDISDLADTCVVVCTPNSGDDIQAIKSGILEIADILVANKSDLPDAERSVQQLMLAQNLPTKAAHKVPIIRTVATRCEGIDKLADAILGADTEGTQTHTDAAVSDRGIRRQLARAVARQVEQQILEEQHNDELEQLCEKIHHGSCSVQEAAAKWLAQQD